MTARLATPQRTRTRESGALQPLVLVVEDHEDTRVLLKIMLEMHGYRVSMAADGEEGLRLALSERPHLVIMDATLPRLDGLAVTRRIRSESELKSVPVVFLSGHAQPDFRAAALAAGGTDFLVKPVSLEHLASVLKTHLHANAA